MNPFDSITISESVQIIISSNTPRYWVGGTGNWDATTVTNWANTSGGPGGYSVPTSANDVVFDSASNATAYTVTVTATANCLSLTIGNPLAGVITFAGASALNISGNYSSATGVNRTSTGIITFNATSGTKTITNNGVVMQSSITFNGIGGTFQLVDNLTLGLLGSPTLTLTNGTFDATTNFTTVTFQCPGGTITGAFTFYNLTRTSVTPAKTDTFTINGSNIIVSNNFTVSAGATVTNRVLVLSSIVGTARTITVNGTNSLSNVDFQDITGAGTASWNLSASSGGSGDCGGNTGITFTTPVAQHWLNASSSTWSTSGNWTSRVPLPQDDVFMDMAFGTSQTVTADMPRLGKSIDWTGATWTTGLTVNSFLANTSYGSYTLISGLNISSLTGGSGYFLNGRGNYTIKLFGSTATFGYGLTINAPTGTYTALSDIACATLGSSFFNLINGTFNADIFNVSMGGFIGNASSTGSILQLGTGIWTVTGTLGWNTSTITTVTPGTSTIKFTDTTATAISFSGSNKTYNNIWFSRGASTGNINIVGNNTFNDFKDTGTAAHSILFTASNTQTVSTFTVSGTVGNVITLNSTTTGAHSLIKSGVGVVKSDYLNIQHSIATPANTWYAGFNSVNNQAAVTSGSGWLFSDPIYFETVTVSENVQISISQKTPSIFDLVTISENVQVNIVDKPSLFDSVTISENVTISVLNLISISVNDTVTVTEFHNEIIPRVVIRYLLNESSGTTVTDSIAGNNGAIKVSGSVYYPFDGNALDSSVDATGTSRGNNGTVNGATLTTDKWGNVNSAYNFVATSGTANTISVPTAAMPHTGFISMWIHPLGDGIADGGGTIAFFNSNLDTRTRLFWSNTGGGNSSGTMKLVKGSTGSTSTGYLASWGTWYHVVATWNATTLKAQFYVNGAQMGADITYADTTTAGTSNLIGSFNAGTGLNGSWTGKIQDFLIGQNYPTAADVLALYNSTSANKLYKPFVAGSIDGGYNLWGQDSAAPSSAGAYIDGGTYVSYQLKNQDPWTIEYRTIPNPNNSAMAGVGWYGGNYMGPYMNISNTGGWSAVVGQGATTGTNSNLNLSGTIGFTPTTWLHVVMRYDGAYVDVFVNNVLLTHTFVGLLVDNGGGNQKFKVNGNPWDNNRLGAAKYDNVNVYSYALSNSEIANNYTQSYVYEGITVSESVSIKINVNLSVTDTVTTTESLSVIHYFNFSTFDTITTLEGPLKPAITGATLSTGYASPTVMDGTIMQTSGPGTADWLNIDNAKAEDGLLATSTVVNGVARFTRYAKATGFGFSIPDGSTINGIQVEIKAQSTSTNRSNWTSAILVVNDVVVGSNLATASAVGLSLVYKVFGDSANLWGLSLTAADVNSSTFGFVIGMGGLNSGSQTFSVDHMRMVVTYTSPSVPEQNTPTVMSICNINVNDTITVTDFADDQTAPLEVNVYENIHPRDWIGMFKAPLAYDVPEYTPFGDTYQINPFGDIGSLPNQMNEAGSGY